MNLESIAPATKTFVVGGHKITLRGITLLEYSDLRSRFPELDQFMATNDAIKYPDILIAFVVASADHAGSKEQAEKFFGSLPVGRLLDLMHKAARLTFGPFDDELSEASPPSSSTNTNDANEAANQNPAPARTTPPPSTS